MNDYQVVHFQPFDPVHKRTEATVKTAQGKQFKVAKGAPQVILQMSTNAEEVKASVDKAVNEFAVRGFRSLGVARSDHDGRSMAVCWSFAVIRSTSRAGQGNHRIGKADGRGSQNGYGRSNRHRQGNFPTAGIGHEHFGCQRIGRYQASRTAQSAEAIEKADGFAQVFPEHKFHIVDVLQSRGHIVGMTGDGVNDAPALKKADCGIAVSGATDAARAAASIVLLASGLSVIIDAIKESRKIFQRMNSYAIYRIAETLRVLFFMTSGNSRVQFLSCDSSDDRDAGASE